MSNRALLLALAACFSVAACEKKEETPKTTTAQAVVPMPPAAPTAPAASSAQDAKPMQMAAAGGKAGASKNPKRPGTKGCGGQKCVVKITDVKPGKPCTATFNADDLEVADENVTITWHITGGWKFDPNGIDLPVGSGQFTNPQGAGTSKFSWVDANTDDKKYKYYVRITKGAEKCVIDPSVVNGAEAVDPNYTQ